MRCARPLTLLAATAALAAGAAGAQPVPTQTLVIGQRSYTMPADTPIEIDGQPAVLSDLLGLPPGLQVRWAPSARGTPTPVFSYTLIGPVTALAPLAVLGQGVTITADTVLEGFADPADLSPGDPLVVAGLVDGNGSLYATLVERRGAQGNRFLLAGRVQAVQDAPVRLRVGAQWLVPGAVAATGCAGPLPVVGDYVEARADAIAGFQPGDPIDTVTDLACANPVPLGTPGAQGAIEGVVGAVLAGDRFAIGALEVVHGATTQFGFGGPDDLEPGALVGIEGTFAKTGELAADAIEFVRPVVRFEAPMAPADVSPGVSLRPFGVEVFHSAQLRDDDGILANGLASPRQVRVRGWLDRDGLAWALRVRDRGAPDPLDARLRGPVEAIAAPALVIQGLAIDTAGAAFFDADKNPIDAATFFADVRLNHMVDIGAASWDAPAATLRGGSITLLGYEHTEPLPGTPGGFLAGTAYGYGVADPVFADGFEAAGR